MTSNVFARMVRRLDAAADERTDDLNDCGRRTSAKTRPI